MNFKQSNIIYRTPNKQYSSPMASVGGLSSNQSETEVQIKSSPITSTSSNQSQNIPFQLPKPQIPTEFENQPIPASTISASTDQPHHQTSSNQPLVSQSSTKAYWLTGGIAILIVFLTLPLLGINIIPRITPVPTTVPGTFEQLGPVETANINQSSHVTVRYIDQQGQSLRFETLSNRSQVSYCPIDTVTTFIPTDAQGGCISTINQDQPNQSTVYYWNDNKNDYFIYADQNAISDQQALLIAESIQPRIVL